MTRVNYAVCFLWCVFTAFLPFPAKAQLFPGLDGDELIEALQQSFTPSHLLTEADVKDTLYGRVFLQNDSVHCIYSNLSRYLPQGVDPSQWLYQNGTESTSMNLEHGWPQSKGAGESTMGNRNMHHLFPSRTAINSDRGDYPYADIPDATTQKWYYLDMVQSGMPLNNIDAYSEYKVGVFEPREEVKGDIARAMFYFWTIYRNDAEAADPDFFEIMRPSLCEWQESDPVDDFEMLRTQRIALYQDGLANPFVLDCTLPSRTYCPLSTACDQVSTQPSLRTSGEIQFDFSSGQCKIASSLSGTWEVEVIDIRGIRYQTFRLEEGVWSESLTGPPGVYILRAYNGLTALLKQVFLIR